MDKIFMQKAIQLAKKAAKNGDVPVGAVVVKDGEIIGTGYNKREKAGSATAHAEILAINAACKALGTWHLNDCELYVTLEPCPMCTGAIINARIKTVIFGAYDLKAGSVDSVINLFNLPYNHTPEVYAGICQNDCSTLLTEFFKGKR